MRKPCEVDVLTAHCFGSQTVNFCFFDVLADRHWEGLRLLEHHPDADAEQIRVDIRIENVFSVEQHFAFRSLVGLGLIKAVTLLA